MNDVLLFMLLPLGVVHVLYQPVACLSCYLLYWFAAVAGSLLCAVVQLCCIAGLSMYVVMSCWKLAVGCSTAVLYCRFINARRHVVQPAAAAADDDNHESSAAKRMRTMLQREARSQFWSPPPHATSVGYTSQAPAAEDAHSLSSTPSSTVSFPTRACVVHVCE